MVDKKDVETRVKDLLKKVGSTDKLPEHFIDEFCTCYVRWAECEEMNTRHGLIIKHPKTGEPIQSPYVDVGLKYLRQMNDVWDRINAYFSTCKVRTLPRIDAYSILREIKRSK